MIWEDEKGEDEESEEKRMVVFKMVGKILYLRIEKEDVKRRMKWKVMG